MVPRDRAFLVRGLSVVEPKMTVAECARRLRAMRKRIHILVQNPAPIPTSLGLSAASDAALVAENPFLKMNSDFGIALGFGHGALVPLPTTSKMDIR
ncbi:hypothetical protein D3C84_1091210 [compost metagenome]